MKKRNSSPAQGMYLKLRSNEVDRIKLESKNYRQPLVAVVRQALSRFWSTPVRVRWNGAVSDRLGRPRKRNSKELISTSAVVSTSTSKEPDGQTALVSLFIFGASSLADVCDALTALFVG